MDKVVYSKRKFLNSRAGLGAIQATLDVSVYGPKNSIFEGSGEVQISDCRRTITLEFYYSTERERHQRLKKLDNMIDILTEFRDAIDQHSVEEIKKLAK